MSKWTKIWSDEEFDVSVETWAAACCDLSGHEAGHEDASPGPVHVHVVRKELLLTCVSAEPGKQIHQVKVDSVNRISVLNLTRVSKGYPVQMLHMSVQGSAKRVHVT